MRRKYKTYCLKPVRPKSQAGFSLLELAVVVAIIGILSSLAIPNILKWISLARVDGVKTLLNTAASECLQQIREGAEPQDITPNNSTISNENLSSYGYQIKSSDNTCASFFAMPTNESDKILYQLGFKISMAGDIVKIAVPAADSASLNSCKNWAGVNCGVSAEQQSIWDALAKIEASKKACNDDFYTWLQKPSSGSYNRWDESSQSCSLVTWAFEGSIQKDEQAVKDARAAKLGALCTAKLKEKESAKFDGAFTDPDCGTTYFCSGKDLATDNIDSYTVCKEKEKQLRCDAALANWKSSKENGIFSESGCTNQWSCNGEYSTSLEWYNTSSCGCKKTIVQYDTGQTKTEEYQCGTITIPGRCFLGRCQPDTSEPRFCTRTVPVMGTKEVCQ